MLCTFFLSFFFGLVSPFDNNFQSRTSFLDTFTNKGINHTSGGVLKNPFVKSENMQANLALHHWIFSKDKKLKGQ
jgi:hypothetical protein